MMMMMMVKPRKGEEQTILEDIHIKKIYGISDFGLVKWLPSQWSHHSIGPIEGTFGHLAPEYYLHEVVDEKADVFAFGVFLLELISARKLVDGWLSPKLA
ncbi:hypothetical protein HN51_063244 [Arachis hypogaea]